VLDAAAIPEGNTVELTLLVQGVAAEHHALRATSPKPAAVSAPPASFDRGFVWFQGLCWGSTL
jgi:hypothetical protein